MRTIWKFPLEFTRFGAYEGTVEMPRGARIVHFAFEYRGPMDSGPRQGIPTVWAEVDDQEVHETRSFQIFGTGHPLPDGAAHVGTFDAEPFVCHVFDTTRAISLPDEIARLPQDAVNAYRLLRREGFYVVRDCEKPYQWTWRAGDNEPTTMEQTMALATLGEHGLGTLADR